MSSEPTRTEMKFTGDPRFLPGIRAAVEFIAARDGLSDAERKGLGAAWEIMARNCMAGLSANHPLCRVLIDEFGDRMEIRLEHPTCFASNASAAAKPDASRGLEVMRRVDRVLYDARNGMSSVTLVKFFRKEPAAS